TLIYLQFALVLAFAWAWPHMGWGARFACAALYALGIGWNLDSVSHNFIHNPFFAWQPLNRLTSFIFSFTLGTPQTMYKYVHMRHHAGNSDRIGADGKTVDPISLYQYGHDGKIEPALSYIFLQFWRDDGPFTVARAIRVKLARRWKSSGPCSRSTRCWRSSTGSSCSSWRPSIILASPCRS